VDEDGNDVAVGTQGEVLIRGFTLMSGYFRSPQATAATIDSGGWLHTGDVGLLTPKNYLSIIDRKKDIIIVGGFNVSPAEVESIILRRGDVAQVAVVGITDERLGEVGVVFVVVNPETTVDEDELLSWCRDHMANYKAPRFAEIIDRLPMNPSGKVRKPELRNLATDLFGAVRRSS
jgi:acyl-CoA synthetase (AMP-forming)/AMP-acid ligase II